MLQREEERQPRRQSQSMHPARIRSGESCEQLESRAYSALKFKEENRITLEQLNTAGSVDSVNDSERRRISIKGISKAREVEQHSSEDDVQFVASTETITVPTTLDRFETAPKPSELNKPPVEIKGRAIKAKNSGIQVKGRANNLAADQQTLDGWTRSSIGMGNPLPRQVLTKEQTGFPLRRKIPTPQDGDRQLPPFLNTPPKSLPKRNSAVAAPFKPPTRASARASGSNEFSHIRQKETATKSSISLRSIPSVKKSGSSSLSAGVLAYSGHEVSKPMTTDTFYGTEYEQAGPSQRRITVPSKLDGNSSNGQTSKYFGRNQGLQEARKHQPSESSSMSKGKGKGKAPERKIIEIDDSAEGEDDPIGEFEDAPNGTRLHPSARQTRPPAHLTMHADDDDSFDQPPGADTRIGGEEFNRRKGKFESSTGPGKKGGIVEGLRRRQVRSSSTVLSMK
ncbi:hypothetical protein BT69DRAFT_541129 [Atractiella rhizophila]|nr:hypothetical protein BT69DRAFT_541129 [Atractiella rhizophila]